MKPTALLSLCVAVITSASGFDYFGPPLKESTRATAMLASVVTVPIVNSGEDTPLIQTLGFLELGHIIPPIHRVGIDGSALGEDRLRKPHPFRAENKTLLEILTLLADSLDAELVIGRGVIRFIPRPAAPQAPAR